MSPPGAHIAATSVAFVHLCFVVFVLVGGFLAWRWRPILFAHLPALTCGIYVEWSGRICPLTPIENSLRAAAGLAPYSGDFVARYLFPMLYPQGLTRATQFLLGVFALAVNVVAYWRIAVRRHA